MSSDLAKHVAGHKPKPNAHAPLGQGGRFAAVEASVAKEPGVKNPAGLAAFLGRKSLGAKHFNNLAAKGKNS